MINSFVKIKPVGGAGDVVLQLLPTQHGLGRIHAKAATGHGCITLLLMKPLQKGMITV